MNGWLIYDEAGAKRNEWFIGECFRLFDFCLEDIRRHMACANDSETAGIGYGSYQFSSAQPCHATLKYRVLDSQHLANFVVFEHL